MEMDLKMGVIKKIMYIFDRKQKIRLFQLCILILIGTVLETVGVTAIVPFISAITYPEQFMENEYIQLVIQLTGVNTTTGLIILLAIILMVVYVSKNIYLIGMYRAQFRFIYNNQRRLSNRLMSCYLKQPYPFHLDHNSAELQNNIFGEVDFFLSTILNIINVFMDGCVCTALIVLLFFTDKGITLGVAALLFIFILTFYRWYKREARKWGKERKLYSQKSIETIQHSLGAIKEIKVLGRESYYEKVYDRNYYHFLESKRKVNTYSMAPKPLMEAMCVTGLLLVVSLKIYQGVEVQSFIPTLSVFALAVIRILPSSSRLTSSISNVLYGKVSIDAIYHDLKEVEKLTAEIPNKKLLVEDIDFKEKISVKNITFQYKEDGPKILDHLSLDIPRNKSVAFVGASGAGKTTLADIILGVLPYSEGNIYVDDKELRDVADSWKKKLGYIPQSIFITDDTIRRNIALGIEDADIDDSKIWKALEEAQLKDFVMQLDKGLDTMLGEYGVRISGGQRQRIGIARALYSNPEILVLDEATSALDNETEKAVMEAIDALNGKKTLIIIAHRLTTIQNCDLVYRIENGKAVLVEKAAE